MEYSGYLVGHVDEIRYLAEQGFKPFAIASALFQAGVRSPYDRVYWNTNDHIKAMSAMVAYVLRGGNRKQKQKIVKVTLEWQTWTPEMQEAEIQMGYTR